MCKASYQPASGLATSSSAPGQRQVIDTPQYYTVYGYTANDIRVQLNKCTPLGGGTSVHYDGETTWYLNYAYDYQPDIYGQCYLTNVAVGLHVAFVYPSWQATQYTAAGVSSNWQNFLSKLDTHEQGHKSIAVQYANELYSGLQSFPHGSCNTTPQSATSYDNNKIANLNQSEADYDTQTNHGISQGAVFP